MKQTHANEGLAMSRGTLTRCVAVWLVATAALAVTARLTGGTALALARSATWQRSFEDLLVAVCAAVLLGCGVRLWLVTTATAVDLVRGRVPATVPGLTRRLVLVACGAAVVAGVGAPATAAQGGDHGVLAGLPLPDRATAGPQAHPGDVTKPRAAAEVVVRSGDSLWSLAEARLPASAPAEEVDRAWRGIYAANRAEIGPDPGLIRPGQRLRMPGTSPHDDR
jgi:LysM domain